MSSQTVYTKQVVQVFYGEGLQKLRERMNSYMREQMNLDYYPTVAYHIAILQIFPPTNDFHQYQMFVVFDVFPLDQRPGLRNS